MAKNEAEPGNSRLYILALGLLVGFVIGFVMLLSRLPVDTSLSDYHSSEVMPLTTSGNADFDFYTELSKPVEQTITVVQQSEPPAVVIKPATRVVPGSAVSTSRRNAAAEDYAEIPASSIGQESYYLQAGSYRGPNEAERMRAAMLVLGFEAFIVKRQDANGVLGHRVRIGPFFDQQRLTEAKKRLRRGNFAYEVVRVTG